MLRSFCEIGLFAKYPEILQNGQIIGNFKKFPNIADILQKRRNFDPFPKKCNIAGYFAKCLCSKWPDGNFVK